MAKKRSFRISTFGSRITSIISVALVLFLLGNVGLTALLGRSLSGEIRSNMGMIVKVCRTVTPAEIAELNAAFTAAPYVESFTFISADEIRNIESEYIGSDLSEILEDNPYASEFDIRVTESYANADSIDILAQRLLYSDAIEDVITDSAIVEGVDRALGRATLVMLIMAAILLIISIVLINNAVSLSIYARRFLIHTMKLVGATGSFIRAPFVKAGAFNGFIAGISASIALGGLLGWVYSLDPLIKKSISWFDASIVFTAMVLVGILICSLASLVATNRFLRKSYDEMYMK